jgi:hypothetical protein
MLRRSALVGAAAACSMLSACATVTRGTHTDFAVESEPSGAAVTTTSGFSCAATPCTLRLPRKEAFDVTVSKPGYATQTVHVNSQIGGGGSAGMAGNIVLGGLVGMAIDGSNGAMRDLAPNPVRVTLHPESTASTASAPAQSSGS